MREKTAASLVAGVQHCAFETKLPEFSEEREIGLFVSEDHADEGDVARKLAQSIAETIERRRIDGELDVIDAHRRQRSRGFQQSVFDVGRIAERRARFASSGDCGDAPRAQFRVKRLRARPAARLSNRRCPPRVARRRRPRRRWRHWRACASRRRLLWSDPKAARSRRSDLLAVGTELLEVRDDVVDVVVGLQTGKNHLGPRDLRFRVFEVFLERGLIPGDA